ncbi:inactive leucine-rich repeat receptor-like protein kinase, partial [Actinidia chinensis var. chinensis]
MDTILMWLSLSYFISVCNGFESDISCLKSIKESLEDPFDYLSSWTFNDDTEGSITSICAFTGVDCWHDDENKVLDIHLSDMGLKGQFPRGIANCTSLACLDLSSNQLFGPIPSDISSLVPFISALNLSFNKFSGEIPPDITNLPCINFLDLDHNQLTGQIPQSLGLNVRFRTFSVANNQLSGPVPYFSNVHAVSLESFAGNKGLCGDPLPSCKDDDDRAFFISGFAIGWSVFTVLVFALSWFYLPVDICLNKFMSNGMKKKNQAAVQDTTQWWPTTLNTNEDSKIFEMEKLVTRMRFTELANATNNFSEANIIKSGKTGTSYKAVLPNGWFLVIERFHPLQRSEEHFVSELTILGTLRHNNLVPLLGF